MSKVPFKGDEVEFCSTCAWAWQKEILKEKRVSVGLTGGGQKTGERCKKHPHYWIKIYTVSSVTMIEPK